MIGGGGGAATCLNNHITPLMTYETLNTSSIEANNSKKITINVISGCGSERLNTICMKVSKKFTFKKAPALVLK